MKIMDLLQHSFILCILPYNQERLFLCLSKRTPYFFKVLSNHDIFFCNITIFLMFMFHPI